MTNASHSVGDTVWKRNGEIGEVISIVEPYLIVEFSTEDYDGCSVHHKVEKLAKHEALKDPLPWRRHGDAEFLERELIRLNEQILEAKQTLEDVIQIRFEKLESVVSDRFLENSETLLEPLLQLQNTGVQLTAKQVQVINAYRKICHELYVAFNLNRDSQ